MKPTKQTAVPTFPTPRAGAAIKQWMDRHGLTQANLAAKIGVRQATVSDWITGKSQPRTSAFRAMAKVSRQSFAEFFAELMPGDLKTTPKPLLRKLGASFDALAQAAEERMQQ